MGIITYIIHEGRSLPGELVDYGKDGTITVRTKNNLKKEVVGQTLDVKLAPGGDLFSTSSLCKLVGVKEEEDSVLAYFSFEADNKEKSWTVERSIEILRPPSYCYDAICDFNSYPGNQPLVSRVQVVSSEHGRPKIVDLTLDFRLKNILVRNVYHYDDESYTLRWETIGGDLKSQKSEYNFNNLGEFRTMATLKGTVTPGFFVPDYFMGRVTSFSMIISMRSLKEYVEKMPLTLESIK